MVVLTLIILTIILFTTRCSSRVYDLTGLPLRLSLNRPLLTMSESDWVMRRKHTTSKYTKCDYDIKTIVTVVYKNELLD